LTEPRSDAREKDYGKRKGTCNLGELRGRVDRGRGKKVTVLKGPLTVCHIVSERKTQRGKVRKNDRKKKLSETLSTRARGKKVNQESARDRANRCGKL